MAIRTTMAITGKLVFLLTALWLAIPTLAQDSADHPQASGHYDVGKGVTQSPIVLYSPDPPYTAAALNANVKGTVVLRVVIGTDGCAHQLKILKKLGYGLDDSAKEAVLRWKFRKPAKPRKMQVEVNFDPLWSKEGSLQSVPFCKNQQ
jgi:TonB family protein